jgi:CHAT domain-containing protein/Tfp pilus assembly protein PilF
MNRLVLTRAGRAVAVALLLVVGNGCSLWDRVKPSRLPGVNLIAKAGSALSPNTLAMVQALGPTAVVAMGAVVEAVAQHVAERRAADAAEQERQRVKMASAQLFYADACTAKGPATNAEPNDLKKQADDAFARADYPAALEALDKAAKAESARSGDKSVAVARILNRQAVVQLAMGNLPEAMGPGLKAYQIRKDAADKAPANDKAVAMTAVLDLAESEGCLGQIYLTAGVLDEGERMLKEALKHRQDKLGEGHLCVASSENSLGELEIAAGAYGKGMELFRLSLTTRRQQLPKDHRDLAQSYDNLASAYRAMALYGHAEEFAKFALQIRKGLGPDHPEVADSLYNLGTIAKAAGDYATAENYFDDALAIRKKRQPGSLEEAQSENALGDLFATTGAFDKAEPRLQRALDLRRKKLSADHPQIADSLENLARLYQAKGDAAAAEKAFREALAIWEKKFGPDNLAVARGLSSLGGFYVATAKYDDAQKALERARTIREAKLGADHPEVAEAIFNLGHLAYARHNFNAAEPLFQTAVDRQRKKLGRGHVQVALSLSYLAATLVALDRGDQALPLFTEAQGIAEQIIRNVGTTSTEARLESLLTFLRAQEEVVYSLLDEPKLRAKAAPLALGVALLRKGRSIDESAARSRLLHQKRDSQADAKVQELMALRTEIASQTVTGASGSGDVQKEMERVEALEQELARELTSLHGQTALPGLAKIVATVAKDLQGDDVLVEIVAYRRYDFHAKPKTPYWGDVRYTALLLDHEAKVTAVPLGDAAKVDAAVKGFLAQITDEGSAADAKSGEDLGKLVVDPLASAWKGAKRIYLSPDGQLNLVPFWALPVDKTLMIDKYEIVYVTSGRDVLRPINADPHSQVVIMAKPDFVPGLKSVPKGETRALEIVDDPKPAQTKSATKADMAARGGLRLKIAPSPLLGTAQEARAIKGILPKATTLMGGAATKEALLGVQAPGILHVATHGLFRSTTAPSADHTRGMVLDDSGLGAGHASGDSRAMTDPLLASMLLMSNSGRSIPGSDGVVLDPAGLATAREISTMDLWGTQLVVLSACESGRGRVDELGQGVYGLRRALVVAGAETLVTSLWKVDDKVTRDLMTLYYRNLKAGQGRVEALRAAAIAIREKHPEPRFWAPFIGIGQSGPLRNLGGK